MSRDSVIKSWLASMSKPELIDQLLFWHDTALEHGRMYNAVKDENAKLRDAVDYLYDFAKTCGVDADDLRELGVEVDG